MKRISLLMVSLCFIISLSSNGQNIVMIPEDASTVSEAVQIAQSGDTILLSAGLYVDSVHISSKNLIFMGDPNGGTVFSPGLNEKSFFLEDAEIQFSHLEFDDFQQNSPPPNFAISANYSNVKIDQCQFNALFSPVSMYWGNLEISNSVFSRTRSIDILHNGGAFLTYNNLFYGIDQTSISINRAHGQFFNNTLVGSTPTEHYGLIINSDSITHIYNNIIDGFGIGIQLTASDSAELGALRIYNNNIYNAAAPYWYEYNEDLSFPIYSGALTPNPGTGEISNSPNFANPINEDFRLLSGSPCIDSGTDNYLFSVDFDLDGNARIYGTNPDIGAYEYSGLTGLDEYESNKAKAEMEIYPQPTQNNVWVRLKESYFGSLEILDISGNVLRRKEINGDKKFEVELPECSGVFLLRLAAGNEVVIGRVVKLI